jgi:hypothetical protein
MYISEEQIKVVVKVLNDNGYRIFDGYMLEEVAIDIINKLNEVIYNGT